MQDLKPHSQTKLEALELHPHKYLDITDAWLVWEVGTVFHAHCFYYTIRGYYLKRINPTIPASGDTK